MVFECFNCHARENLYKAPQTAEMRRKWMELFPDGDETIFSDSFRLCAEHFDNKYILPGGVLSARAVPTKFLVHNVWCEIEDEFDDDAQLDCISDDDVELVSEIIPDSPKPVILLDSSKNTTTSLHQDHFTSGTDCQKTPHDAPNSELVTILSKRNPNEFTVSLSTEPTPENPLESSKLVVAQNVQNIERVLCSPLSAKPHPASLAIRQIFQATATKLAPQNDKIVVTQQNFVEANACKPKTVTSTHLSGVSSSPAENAFLEATKLTPNNVQVNVTQNSVIEIKGNEAKAGTPPHQIVAPLSPSRREPPLSTHAVKSPESKVVANVAPPGKEAASIIPKTSPTIVEDAQVVKMPPSTLPTVSQLTCKETPKVSQKRVSFSPNIEFVQLSRKPSKILKAEPITTRSGRTVTRKRLDLPANQRKKPTTYKRKKRLNNSAEKNLKAAVIMLKKLRFPNNKTPRLGTMLSIKTLEELNNFSVRKKQYTNGHGASQKITQTKSPPVRKIQQVKRKSEQKLMNKIKEPPNTITKTVNVPFHVPTDLPIWQQLDLYKRELKRLESRTDALNRQCYVFDAKHTRLKEFLDKLVENKMISKK